MAEHAGGEFDVVIAESFVRMMRSLETRVTRVTEAGEVVGAET
jgi:hypothetical protein